MWPGYEPLYLARELGFLDNKKIKLVELTSSSEVLRAFRNGALDGAAITLDELFLLREQGIDARAILVVDSSNGADVILGQPEIKNLSDAKGKRVGYEDTALGAFFLCRALEIAHLSKNDITLVPLEVDEHARAFLEKKIDVVVTFEPVKSRLLAAGANQLFDSSRIPNEIIDVLVVRTEALQNQKTLLKQLLQSWYLALSYFKEKPNQAAQIMQYRLKITPSDILKSCEGLTFPDKKQTYDLMTKGTPSSLDENLGRLNDFMQQNELLSKKIETHNVIDNLVIKEVQ